MPTIIEPVGAGLLVALINKFVINNPQVWMQFCGCGTPNYDNSHEDASSSTTSVNDVEIQMHHF